MARIQRGLERRHLLIASMVTTFVVVRAWLHVQPDTDLTLGRYNIHHLFTGVLILTVCAIPAILRERPGKGGAVLIAGSGVGLTLVLDEWFYLIVTDGSNAAYVQWPSLLSGTVAVGLACLYALMWRSAEGSDLDSSK